MRGGANNVWGMAYRSCTRAQNGGVNCAPFNFRTSVKASDSEPELVFDVLLKLLPEMMRYRHLVEKIISVLDTPGERISSALKSGGRLHHRDKPQAVTKKLLKVSEIICTLDSRLQAYAYGSLNDLCRNCRQRHI